MCNNTDKELKRVFTPCDIDKQKGYGIGIFMLTLISQYQTTERLGVSALFFNRLSGKEHEFAKKRQQYALKLKTARKKHKPLPKPPMALYNYDRAVKAAIVSWDEALKNETSKISLSVSGVFNGFWLKEKKILSSLYGFKEQDFKAFEKDAQPGYLFRSIKIANLLIARLQYNLYERLA